MADQIEDYSGFNDDYNEEKPDRPQKFQLPEGEAENNNGDELANTTAPVGRKLSEQEEKLKKFGGRIGLLEMIGNQVKAMTCAWASFVLLGAFSNDLFMRDLWFATIILLQTKINLFNYKYVIQDWGVSQETGSGSGSGTGSKNNSRFWSCFLSRGVPKPKTSKHLPRLFSVRRGLIVLVYILELSAAILFLAKTLAVSSSKLAQMRQDSDESFVRNEKYSLVLFYCLVILESAVFLAENMYYFSKVVLHGEFQKMSSELGFGKVDLIPVHGFFIDCVTNSSDAERDMVTFGVDLMASDLHDKQLVGARILSTFVSNSPDDFSRKVLINIGANVKALTALVGILDSCRLDDDEHNLWRSTATVLSKLTTVEENAVRVDQIPASTQIICCHLLKKGSSKWNTTYWRLESEILANLAKEEDAKDRIGRISSGGVLKKLLKIFFKRSRGGNSDDDDARDAVGNAIAMLTFQGESNCRRILKLNLLKRFIQEALGDRPVSGLHMHAKKVLRNLCMYSGASCDEQFMEQLVKEAPRVFKMIVDEDVSSEKGGKEIIVGIAACITCKFKTLEKSTVEKFGVEEDRLAAELVEMLSKCKHDDDPILVRSVIEVASWMINNSPRIVDTFLEKNLENILQSILDSADEDVSDDFELQFLVYKALDLLKQPITQG